MLITGIASLGLPLVMAQDTEQTNLLPNLKLLPSYKPDFSQVSNFPLLFGRSRNTLLQEQQNQAIEQLVETSNDNAKTISASVITNTNSINHIQKALGGATVVLLGASSFGVNYILSSINNVQMAVKKQENVIKKQEDEKQQQIKTQSRRRVLITVGIVATITLLVIFYKNILEAISRIINN